jgi:hypothetical protein
MANGMMTSTSIDDATAFSEAHPFQGGFDFNLFMDFIFGGSQPGGVTGYGGGPLDDSLLDILLRLYNKELTLEEAYEQYPDEMQIFEDAAEQYRTQFENSIDDWDELEEWEKDRYYLENGFPDYYGTAGQEPTENDTPTFEGELGENPQPDLPDPTRPDVPVPGVEDENPLQEAIDAVQEQFPTFEDLWEAVGDQLPSDPKEWGEAIRSILEAAGVNLPSGDIWDILNGGYGVTTQIDPRWGGIEGIFDPDNLLVFIPGLPVGLPPSSTIIGSIEDLVTDPVGTITDKIESVLGDIVSDPGGFIEGILTGALEVPADIWDMILGGVAVGQELYDWLIESGIDHAQPPDVPPLGGAADEDEEEKESFDRVEQTESLLGDMTAAFGDTTAEEDPLVNVEDPNKYGFPGSETAEEDVVGDDQVTEDPFDRVEQTENSLSDLISGFESNDSDLTFGGATRQEEIGSDPTVSQEPEDTLSGSSGGAGGGGGGASKPYEFMARLNYLRPEMVPIISQGQVDFNSSMFNKPQQKRKGLQLGSITESLFERFI